MFFILSLIDNFTYPLMTKYNKFMQNLREIYENVLETNKFQKQVEKAKKEFEVKPFVQEFFRLNNFVKILKPALNFISVLLAFGFLYYQFSTNLNEYVSAGLAVMLLVFLEIAKNEILQIAFYRTYTARFDSLQSTLLLFSLAILAGSAYTSIKGAEEMYLHLDRSKTVLDIGHASKKDSVLNHYATEINAEKKALEDFKNSVSWEGKINIYNPTTSKKIENHESRIMALAKERKEALERHDALAESQKTNLHEKTGFNIMFWVAISGINEILILLCIWFGIWYQYRVDRESAIFSPASQKMTLDIESLGRMFHLFMVNGGNLQPVGMLPNTGILDAPDKKEGDANTIGFQIPNKEKAEKEIEYRYVEGKGFLVTCPVCGRQAYRKSIRAKYCGDECKKKQNRSQL